MSKYTAEDFKNAKFAEHPDGDFAARLDPAASYAWESTESAFMDKDMADKGWVPVQSKSTMTCSEYRDILDGAVEVSGYGNDWERGFSTGLAVAGMRVVPDPKPTNEERLEALYWKWGNSNDEVTLIEYLDKAGVKAPEEDK